MKKPPQFLIDECDPDVVQYIEYLESDSDKYVKAKPVIRLTKRSHDPVEVDRLISVKESIIYSTKGEYHVVIVHSDIDVEVL